MPSGQGGCPSQPDLILQLMFSRATNFPLQEGKEKAAVTMVNASGSQKNQTHKQTKPSGQKNNRGSRAGDTVTPMLCIFQGSQSAPANSWGMQEFCKSPGDLCCPLSEAGQEADTCSPAHLLIRYSSKRRQRKLMGSSLNN